MAAVSGFDWSGFRLIMSSLLVLKLILGPLMVLSAHYLQRNYGDTVGGRLIGLPITTGPFILIIYLQEGRTFAAHVAHGVLLGQIALATFCWIYAIASSRSSWWVSLTVGTLTVLLTGYFVTQLRISNLATLGILIAIWLIAMKFWPQHIAQGEKAPSPPWELPVRIAVTVSVLTILAALAPHLGAKISGALSTYPVIASVISAFNHRRYGPASTISTLRGLMETLPITVTFIAVLAFSL